MYIQHKLLTRYKNLRIELNWYTFIQNQQSNLQKKMANTFDKYSVSLFVIHFRALFTFSHLDWTASAGMEQAKYNRLDGGGDWKKNWNGKINLASFSGGCFYSCDHKQHN